MYLEKVHNNDVNFQIQHFLNACFRRTDHRNANILILLSMSYTEGKSLSIIYNRVSMGDL